MSSFPRSYVLELRELNANTPKVLVTPRRVLNISKGNLQMSTSDSTSNIPYGYCQCGCGQKTSIARESNKKRGHVKGEPVRYLTGHYAKRSYEKMIAEFWANVAITADDNQCWLWTGYCMPNGYGSKSWGNKDEYAHRVSWIIANGDIPRGMEICHTCDVRNCVNPKHLFLGTQQDNMRDMVAKGRQVISNRSGENNGNCKLTETQVREIRHKYSMGSVSHKELGNQYGVNKVTIGHIVTRRLWKNIK